eukprot:TRINITY_DN8208_c0_g1_i7.p1 TRINITY_DN8208_c0_g1~~TRINITY_DN8208_c0_g1_i7.p1  ORF type:complete len:111 (+),score=19.97 TRINITY_DN8208_c0_g1_i7:68-400(+)
MCIRDRHRAVVVAFNEVVAAVVHPAQLARKLDGVLLLAFGKAALVHPRALPAQRSTAIRISTVSPYSALIPCLLYTSDAADEEDSVDLGGRRIIKKKTNDTIICHGADYV